MDAEHFSASEGPAPQAGQVNSRLKDALASRRRRIASLRQPNNLAVQVPSFRTAGGNVDSGSGLSAAGKRQPLLGNERTSGARGSAAELCGCPFRFLRPQVGPSRKDQRPGNTELHANRARTKQRHQVRYDGAAPVHRDRPIVIDGFAKQHQLGSARFRPRRRTGPPDPSRETAAVASGWLHFSTAPVSFPLLPAHGSNSAACASLVTSVAVHCRPGGARSPSPTALPSSRASAPRPERILARWQ
jgi:hypothetical protein